jgi:hypothetical protein
MVNAFYSNGKKRCARSLIAAAFRSCTKDYVEADQSDNPVNVQA